MRDDDRFRMVSARLALPLLREMRGSGIDPSPILTRLGLREDDFRPLEARMPLAAWLDLREASIDATQDPNFPLFAASRIQSDAFPAGLYLLGSQMTVRDGWRFSAPYMDAVIDGLHVELIRGETQSHFEFQIEGGPIAPPSFAEFCMVSTFAYGMRVIPGTTLPDAINFVHDKPPHGDYLVELVPCPIRFGCRWVGFEFPSAWIDLPIHGADPQLGQVLADRVADWLSKETPAWRQRDRVRQWLLRNLRGAEPVAKRLARAMKVSERTLRRKLSDEGTTIRELVDEARRDRAFKMLEIESSSLDGVAYELGFSSATAFCRAFKRWTGSSPAQYRSRDSQPDVAAEPPAEDFKDRPGPSV